MRVPLAYVLLTFYPVWTHSTWTPALDADWLDWKATHQREYITSVEELFRRSIWEKNLQLIEAHNQEYELGIHTYELAMNHLGDMTTEEVVPTWTDMQLDLPAGVHKASFPNPKALPCSIDYRLHDPPRVTSVKNEGDCKASWAFSVVGAMEGQVMKAMKLKRLENLSAQMLVDCVESNDGCGSRGKLWPAYIFVIKNGTVSDKIYKYMSKKGKCIQKKCDYKVKNARPVKFGNESDLAQALVTYGPVSVTMDTSQPTFTFYKHGVYTDFYCRPNKPNRAMLLVGYTPTAWIVKNSWGEMWGDKGYIYVKRDRNICGIGNGALFPVMV